MFKAAGLFCGALFVLLTHGLAQGLITTVVGPQLPASGEPALNQAIDFPSDVVPGDSGSVYVVSANQNRVYRIADGILTIIAGSTYGFGGDGGLAANARFASPSGAARDPMGNLYIADTYNHRIRRITKDGVITTIAGTGTAGGGGDNGPATSAQLGLPTAITVDRNGNIYFAESDNGRVRRIDTNGVISTVAGGGNSRPDTSGIPATSAALSPTGVAVDASGNIYIASGFVLKVTPDGTMTPLTSHTVTGGGRGGFTCTSSGDGGPASAANVCFPNRLAVDQSGNLYLIDSGRIREITTDGLIQTVAGGGTSSADGVQATTVSLRAFALSLDLDGSLYISEADTSSLFRSVPSSIRKVTPDGVIATIVANAVSGFSGDGGPASSAQLSAPGPIAVDSEGNLYIADYLNNRIRKVSADGVIQSVAGNGTQGFSARVGDGGPATSAEIRPSLDIVVDSSNNLYILEEGTGLVRKITTDGVINTIAGCSGSCTGAPNADGLPATQAVLVTPRRIAVDAAGTLYIAENDRIRKVGADGIITTALTFDRNTYNPIGFALDPAGGFYISSQFTRTCQISKLSLDGSATVIAGSGPCGFPGTGDGGPATSAELSGAVTGIKLDAAGNIYFIERPRVRKVSRNGIITTVSGGTIVPGFSGDGGTATAAQFNDTLEIAVDGAGILYISDNGNHRVRRVSPSVPGHSFSLAASGADHQATTAAAVTGPLALGYGSIQPASGNSTPYGLAVFSFRSNGVLVSETAVPASSPRLSGRIYAENSATIRTGVAMVNPNDDDARISFYFTDQNGVNLNAGSTVLPAHEQYAAFLDEAPYDGSDAARSFTFTSSVAVGAIALRGHLNERGDFLMTTLPVGADSPNSADSPRPGDVILPHFASGGGWTTQVLLVNPTDQPLSGSVEMDMSQAYAIAPRSSTKVLTANSDFLRTGVIRVSPASSSGTPVVSSVFTFVSNGITVTENGIATTGVAQSFRLFAEFDSVNRLRTAIAIANISASNANIQFELLTMDGRPSGYAGSTTLDSNGHVAVFLNEIPGLNNLPSNFQGMLHVSSNTAISAIGLRTRYNERGDFLISTTPAIADNAAPTTQELIFPHVVSGGGYTTEFILMNSATATRGTLSLKSQTGTELPLLLP
jgi:sugar lactone lactonase YvrE